MLIYILCSFACKPLAMLEIRFMQKKPESSELDKKKQFTSIDNMETVL